MKANPSLKLFLKIFFLLWAQVENATSRKITKLLLNKLLTANKTLKEKFEKLNSLSLFINSLLVDSNSLYQHWISLLSYLENLTLQRRGI